MGNSDKHQGAMHRGVLKVVFYGCNKICLRLIHVALGVFFLGVMMSGCQSMDANRIPPKPQVYPNLDSGLSKIVSVYETDGIAAAFDAVKSQGIKPVDIMLRVTIEARPGNKDAVMAAITKAEGRVETSYEDLIQAVVPIRQLKALAGNVAVSIMRLPITAHPEGSSGPEQK